MSDSVYAPPNSNLEVELAGTSSFYVVAPRKFLLLTILTGAVYLVYWFYRNWRIVRDRTGESMWPPMRGLFYVFFTHSLFRRVDRKIKSLHKTYDWSPGTTATAVVVLTILMNVLGRGTDPESGSAVIDFLSIALIPVLAVVMLPAQRAINVACGDEDGRSNARLTGANWAWLIVGALLWIFMLLGLLFLYLPIHSAVQVQ